jgi:hypothetical protein
MCDFDGRLIAWLDHELPAEEAADVGRHITACAGCRKRADAYERASAAFDAYCDAVGAAERHEKLPIWKSAVISVGAVAAVVMLAVLVHHPRREAIQTQSSVSAPRTKASPTASAGALTAAARRTEVGPMKGSSVERGRRRSIPDIPASGKRQDADLLPTGPAVEIAVPADAVLPPGAAPQGAIFLIDLSIAPDGSAQRVRLTSQGTGLERRVIQP